MNKDIEQLKDEYCNVLLELRDINEKKFIEYKDVSISYNIVHEYIRKDLYEDTMKKKWVHPISKDNAVEFISKFLFENRFNVSFTCKECSNILLKPIDSDAIIVSFSIKDEYIFYKAFLGQINLSLTQNKK